MTSDGLRRLIQSSLVIVLVFPAIVEAQCFLYQVKRPSPTASFNIDSSIPVEWIPSIRFAAGTWNNAGSGFQFNTIEDPQSQNRITFTPFPKNYCGVSKASACTTSDFDPNTGIIFEGSTLLEFNSGVKWSTFGQNGKYDVQSVATHEFGHWLSLGDLGGIKEFRRCRDEIMFGVAKGATKLTLGAGDIEGIRTIYPPQTTVIVFANPLWTDTGIVLSTSENVTIAASGSWSWDGATFVGPEGGPAPPIHFDEFQHFDDNDHGRLIGFIGPDPCQGHCGDGTTFFPQSSGYYSVGAGATLTAPTGGGKLWLGFNDDARSGVTFDNAGSVTAVISVTH